MNGVPNAGNNFDKVIHLFASSVNAPRGEEQDMPKARSTRLCCILSAGGGIVQTFYLCNLGICWAEGGLDFSLLDLETRLPTSSYLLGSLAENAEFPDELQPIKEPWSCFYGNCDESNVTFDGKSTLKLFLLNKSGAEHLSSDSRDMSLVYSFKQVLDEFGMTWINYPERMAVQSFPSHIGVRKFLFISRPDLKSIIQTFDLMKKVSASNPEASFGLLFHRTASEAQIYPAFNSLSRAVRIELHKNLQLIGHLQSHPAIAESILERFPLFLNKEFPNLRDQIGKIAETLWEWANGDSGIVAQQTCEESDAQNQDNIGQGI